MNPLLYRVWLPISIVLHVGLLALLGIIKLPPLAATSLPPSELTIIPILEAPPVANLQHVPPPPPPPTSDLAIKQGVPNPVHANGNSPKEGVVPVPRGKGGESTAPGHGEGRKAPPALLTAPHGVGAVPPGVRYGTGTGGTEVGDEGPSYGAAMQGGDHGGGPSKRADELRLSGRVLVRVTVGSNGQPTDFRISESSGSDILDDEALRIVSHQTFTAAMNRGTAVDGIARVRVTFAFGKNPYIEVVK